MTLPIENCASCVAADDHLNPHHFLRNKEATETVAGVTVHPGCKRDIETAMRFWLDGSAHWKDGAYRWKSNNSVPNKDMIGRWMILGYITADEAEASIKLRKIETDAFLKAYRKNPPKITAEDRYEMRAAFGEGAEVVNIITGKVTKL